MEPVLQGDRPGFELMKNAETRSSLAVSFNPSRSVRVMLLFSAARTAPLWKPPAEIKIPRSAPTSSTTDRSAKTFSLGTAEFQYLHSITHLVSRPNFLKRTHTSIRCSARAPATLASTSASAPRLRKNLAISSWYCFQSIDRDVQPLSRLTWRRPIVVNEGRFAMTMHSSKNLMPEFPSRQPLSAMAGRGSKARNP